MKQFILTGFLAVICLAFPVLAGGVGVPSGFFPSEVTLNQETGSRVQSVLINYFKLDSPQSNYNRISIKVISAAPESGFTLKVYLYHKTKYLCDIYNVMLDRDIAVLSAQQE